MMADFVGCMPVFPEFEYLDYNYFNSFLGQNVMQSHFSTGKNYVFENVYLKLQSIASVCRTKIPKFDPTIQKFLPPYKTKF